MRRSILPLLAVMVSVALCSCAAPMTQRERGALTGAALGAGTGALIGSTRGDAAEGAAIGGAIGALGGGLLGDQLEGRARAGREQDERLQRQKEDIARNRQLLDELRRRDLDVRETSRGVVVNLPDVLFEFDRADLTGAARRKVGDIADVLDRRARGRSVSIEGHTDARGTDAYNERLSLARAESVAAALAGDGVGRGRLRTRGFGERLPVAPNTVEGRDNPSGRAKNRRVEVVIENVAVPRSAPPRSETDARRRSEHGRAPGDYDDRPARVDDRSGSYDRPTRSDGRSDPYDDVPTRNDDVPDRGNDSDGADIDPYYDDQP